MREKSGNVFISTAEQGGELRQRERFMEKSKGGIHKNTAVIHICKQNPQQKTEENFIAQM